MKKILLFSAIALSIFSFGLIAKAEVLPTVHVDDENSQVLRSENEQLNVFDKELQKLINDMEDTMHAENGCGLAAPQIGKNLKIFVAQLSSGFQEFINPEILEKSEETNTGIEGCLSIRDSIGIVKRPNVVKIQAFNKNGEKFILELRDFDARIVCHESDHLDKILYTDIAEAVIDTKGLNKNQLKSKVLEALAKIIKK